MRYTVKHDDHETIVEADSYEIETTLRFTKDGGVVASIKALHDWSVEEEPPSASG